MSNTAAFPQHKKCNTYGTYECQLTTDCMDTTQWWCHNWSCGMRPMEISLHDVAQLGLSPARVLKVFNDDQLHTSAARWLSSINAIFQMATTSTHSRWDSFCGQIRYALWMRVVSTSTIVTSGHVVILMLYTDVGMKTISVSAFRLASSGTLLWDPICCPVGWLLNDVVIFWELFYRGCWRCASSCEAESGCGFSKTELKHTVGKMSGSCWMQHIQEGELDIKDRLHGLFSCQI